MRRISLFACTIILTGCANMTPAERTTAMIVGGVIVTAVIISADSGYSDDDDCYTVIRGTDQTTTCR